MKIKDHFLSQEEFKIIETEIQGIYKTSPLPDDLGKYYESKDYISHHQDSGSLKEEVYKFLQKFNLNYKKNIIKNEIGNHLKILDYGCGAGEFVKFIENEYTTFGFEPNENARNFAKQKSEKTIFISSPELTEIENESLDAITLWHVFEHIEEREKYLKIFHEKLKPNGLLIIAVPNHTSYDGKKYKEFWAAYDVPRHLWHFSQESIRLLFEEKGFKLIGVKPMPFDAFYVSLLSEKYKSGRMNFLKGFYHGLLSNLSALRTGEYSSLIYLLKVKGKK